MIQIHSDISSQKYCLLDDKVIKSNDSSVYRIAKFTANIKNTTEEKINHIDVESGASTKMRLLKYFLVGVTILTGIGALTAGGYYYMLEKTNSGGH